MRTLHWWGLGECVDDGVAHCWLPMNHRSNEMGIPKISNLPNQC